MLKLIKNQVEECENIYKMIGILAIIHAIVLFVIGIAILLELIIFSVLKIFQSLGRNLILFIGIGIIICFLIGGSVFGIIVTILADFFA